MASNADNVLELQAIEGIRVGTVSAGIKKVGRKDVVLFELAPGAHTAAVFTRNAFCAAPVLVAREHLQAQHEGPRYLLVNTGNANAGTGAPGMAHARASAAAVAAEGGVKAEQVLPFSTGVIGEPLPIAKIEAAIPAAFSALSGDADAWVEAATGIMTTDTRPKGCSVTFNCAGKTYTMTGIAKGAGMLRPNMATMLAYIATDMAVDTVLLQSMLSAAVETTFNRVTVDGDTSTNDACVLVASGSAGNALVSDQSSKLYPPLRDALEQVCLHLAQALVRDGEGASKFVEVAVSGGRNEQECLDVGFTIGHSPLVKTALFASDPNWGRLLAAIGRAGLTDLDVDKVSVYLNDVLIALNGRRADSYTEAQGVAAMAPADILIRIELGRGDAVASIWTTDFSYDYVRINAEYRS